MGGNFDIYQENKYEECVPLILHIYIEKMGFAGVDLFFFSFFFCPKHRLRVLVRTACFVLSKCIYIFILYLAVKLMYIKNG